MHYPTQSSQQPCEIGTITYPVLHTQETGKEEIDSEVYTYCCFVRGRKAEWGVGGKKK